MNKFGKSQKGHYNINTYYRLFEQYNLKRNYVYIKNLQSLNLTLYVLRYKRHTDIQGT